MRKTFGLLTGFLILLVSLTAQAADNSTLAQAAPSLAALAALVLCQAAAWGLRKFNEVPFFHEPAGAVVISLVTAVLGAVVPVVQARGIDKNALLWAALNGALSFFTTSNPSNSTAAQKDAVEAKRAIRMARMSRSSASGTGGRQAALYGMLVIAFLGLGAPTCTPGEVALGNCELQHLPQTLQTALVLITSIAADSSKTADDFATAGQGLAPGQLDCAVAAVSKAVKGRMPTHGQADSHLVAMAKKLDEYSAKHPPTACRDFGRL